MVSATKSALATRSAWTALSDQELLSQCDIDTYRASGPGGQKRNKTSSTVRLRHRPSGVLVIAEESRSQHENKARALRRLRRRLYLQFREPFILESNDELASAVRGTRLKFGIKDPRYWPAVGLVLDALEHHQGRVAETAEAVGVSTGNLVDFFQTDAKLWEQANTIRKRFGHKVLKD